jgi:hypothetical protein
MSHATKGKKAVRIRTTSSRSLPRVSYNVEMQCWRAWAEMKDKYAVDLGLDESKDS